MRIVLSGGTGFIGSKLITQLLERGDALTVLTRNVHRAKKKIPKVSLVEWNPKQPGAWQNCIDGADALIHLAGKPILENRWNTKVKKEITESRCISTQLLVDAVLQSKVPPRVFLSASGVGFYGEARHPTDESGAVGQSYLAQVCKDWEKPLELLDESLTRTVAMRIGIVLGDEGALPKMRLNMRFFSGFGNAEQFLSWIHWRDVCQIIVFALENDAVSGPLNVTGPKPVTMRQSTMALAKAMDKTFLLPIPDFAIRLALGEMADAVLTGQNAIPKKLTSLGYRFAYPTIDAALQDLLR